MAQQEEEEEEEDNETNVYRRGLWTIAGITVLFVSNSPVLHAAYASGASSSSPPVLLLNAGCSMVALATLLVAGPILNHNNKIKQSAGNNNLAATLAVVQDSSRFTSADDGKLSNGDMGKIQAATINDNNKNSLWNVLLGKANDNTNNNALADDPTLQAGMELGLWKFLGTLANMYGLSQTSAGHGAFLIQLTTLIVPLAQGVMGVPIPRRIWTAIALALAGVLIFTQDVSSGAADATDSSMSLKGDVACIGAAVMYATYDLRLFHWGKLVEPLELITSKIITQTTLSLVALAAFSANASWDFVQSASPAYLQLVVLVGLWSGLAVNAVAPYLQVGGQQSVGPARAQIMYASQPLWASLLSFFLLGETIGTVGLIGGAAFLTAMMLAATAELPDPQCEQDICEV